MWGVQFSFSSSKWGRRLMNIVCCCFFFLPCSKRFHSGSQREALAFALVGLSPWRWSLWPGNVLFSQYDYALMSLSFHSLLAFVWYFIIIAVENSLALEIKSDYLMTLQWYNIHQLKHFTVFFNPFFLFVQRAM